MEKGLLANGGWYWSLILALGPKPPLEKQQPEVVRVPAWVGPHSGRADVCSSMQKGHLEVGARGRAKSLAAELCGLCSSELEMVPRLRGLTWVALGELLLWLGVEQRGDDGTGHAQQSAGEHFP